MKILFVCSANVDRSPTAEYIYKDREELEVKSAGTARYARTPVNEELLRWADVILCMENRQKRYIVEEFAGVVSHKTVDSLDIPDVYYYLHPSLVAVIKEKTDAWLRKYQSCKQCSVSVVREGSLEKRV